MQSCNYLCYRLLCLNRFANRSKYSKCCVCFQFSFYFNCIPDQWWQSFVHIDWTRLNCLYQHRFWSKKKKQIWWIDTKNVVRPTERERNSGSTKPFHHWQIERNTTMQMNWRLNEMHTNLLKTNKKEHIELTLDFDNYCFSASGLYAWFWWAQHTFQSTFEKIHSNPSFSFCFQQRRLQFKWILKDTHTKKQQLFEANANWMPGINFIASDNIFAPRFSFVAHSLCVRV